MGLFSELRRDVAEKGWRAVEKLAWGLLAFWAMLWLVFSVFAGAYELIDGGLLSALTHAILPVLIAVTLWTAWRWQVVGGSIAVFVSFVCILWYGFESWYVVLLLDVPPLVGGVLLATSWIKYNEELQLRT